MLNPQMQIEIELLLIEWQCSAIKPFFKAFCGAGFPPEQSVRVGGVLIGIRNML